MQDVTAGSGRIEPPHWGAAFSVGHAIYFPCGAQKLTINSNEDVRKRAAADLKELVVITARGAVDEIRPLKAY